MWQNALAARDCTVTLLKDIMHCWSQAFRRIGGPLAEAHSEDLAKRLQDWSEGIVYEFYTLQYI